MAAFVDNSWFDVRERNSMAITVNLHTKSHTVRGRPTLNLVERFGNGSVINSLQCVCNEFMLFDCNDKQGINFAYDLVSIMNEYWKSVVFKFVSVNQSIIFNADRITHSFKCVLD